MRRRLPGPAALAALQARVDELWAGTGLGPSERLRSQDAPAEAHSYVECRDGAFRFVQWERGAHDPLTPWPSAEDAATWALAGMAADRAQAEEVRRRRGGAYSRWNWMAPAIATMARISPEHGAALAAEYGDVLRRAPLSEADRRAAWHPSGD